MRAFKRCSLTTMLGAGTLLLAVLPVSAQFDSSRPGALPRPLESAIHPETGAYGAGDRDSWGSAPPVPGPYASPDSGFTQGQGYRPYDQGAMPQYAPQPSQQPYDYRPVEAPGPVPGEAPGPAVEWGPPGQPAPPPAPGGYAAEQGYGYDPGAAGPGGYPTEPPPPSAGSDGFGAPPAGGYAGEPARRYGYPGSGTAASPPGFGPSYPPPYEQPQFRPDDSMPSPPAAGPYEAAGGRYASPGTGGHEPEGGYERGVAGPGAPDYGYRPDAGGYRQDAPVQAERGGPAGQQQPAATVPYGTAPPGYGYGAPAGYPGGYPGGGYPGVGYPGGAYPGVGYPGGGFPGAGYPGGGWGRPSGWDGPGGFSGFPFPW